MKLGLVSTIPIGDVSSPFGSKNKRIAPAVLAAIISGGAAVATGAANLFSEADTNKANRDIAQANRDWQSQENRLAEQWSDQMWEKQFNLTNQYNTPSAMRARLSEGGYNPFLFDGAKTNAAGQASMGSVPSPARQSAPNQPTMQPLDFGGIGRGVQSAAEVYANVKGVDAQAANQQSQADLNQAKTVEAIYRSLGKDAAVSYAKKIGYDMPDETPSIRLLDQEMNSRQLANNRAALENDLIDKYGAKKAAAEIANLEELTGKYFAEVGLMATQSELMKSQKEVNESEVRLNDRKAYALGAQMARDMAQAGLFTSEAAINRGIINFVISKAQSEANNAAINAGLNAMNFETGFANYVGNTTTRDYIMSPAGQSRRLWNYQQSPEGNYVNSFIGGFTSNLNGIVGVNANLNRSWSKSGSVNTSHSFIYSNH